MAGSRAGAGGQGEPALFGAQSCHIPLSHESSPRSGFYCREPVLQESWFVLFINLVGVVWCWFHFA